MRALRLAIGGLSLAQAGAASAQQAAPLPPSPEALVKLHDYAACLATKRPKVVRETLAMDYRNDDYRNAIRAVSGGANSCIPIGRLGFASVLVAGGMAEQVYKTDFGSRGLRDLFPADWGARPIASRSPSEYAALCMVQRHPDAVQTLIYTRPASDEERTAFQPLIAALPACMPAETKFAFNRPFYRAILSLAAYRAARHFSAPVATVKN